MAITVDLGSLNPLVEIIVRAGDASDQNARQRLQEAYLRVDPNYPDTIGASTLFRLGATLDELAREGSFPHKMLSYSVIGSIQTALDSIGYDLVLFVTPTHAYPDHHALAVAMNGAVQPTLSDDAADAILNVLGVVLNPYRSKFK